MEVVPRLLLPLPRGRRHGLGPRSEPAQVRLLRGSHHPRPVPQDGPRGSPGKRDAVLEGAPRPEADRADLFVREGALRSASRPRQAPPRDRRAMRFLPAGTLLACFVSFAARADLVFVSDERGDAVRALPTEDNTQVAVTAAGKRPRGMRRSLDRKTVYVALGDEDAVALVDVDSRKVVGKVPVGRDPEQVALSRDGKVLYVSNEAASTATAVEIASQRKVFASRVGTEPEGVGVAPSGRKVYVTGESSDDVTVLDARSGKVLRRFKVGARPRWVAFSPDGKQAFVSAEVGGTLHFVDLASDKPRAALKIGNGQTKPDGLAVSPDGKLVYVAEGRGAALRVDFAARTLRGEATLDLPHAREGPLDLDTRDLDIESVATLDARPLRYRLEPRDPILGSRLRIDLPAHVRGVRIGYATSPNATALQWLDPGRSGNADHPLLYSQCQ